LPIAFYIATMTLHDFMVMDRSDKARAARTGNFLSLREDEDHQKVLYKVNNFFVEVYYHLDSNAIERIRPFKTTWRLRAYFSDRLN
jgi:hypothetical protein